MVVKCHGSYLGINGFNAHTRNAFRGLSKYAKVYVRNFSVDDHNINSYINDVDKEILSEQTLWTKWKDLSIRQDYPFIWNDDYLDKNVGEKINLILAENYHYYFFDNYYGPKIAYTVWETDLYDPIFFNLIKTFDSNIVPSKWQKECLIKQGLDETKIDIVHEGIENDCFPIIQEKSDKFKFLLVGRWGFRKATREIIQCFLNTFKNFSDVELHISVDNDQPTIMSTIERLKYYNLTSDKIVIHNFPKREMYLHLLKNCNVFLSCSRGEGWNIPLAEAFACGIPSIYSKGSGQVEFANEYPLGVDILKKVHAFNHEEKYYGHGFVDEPNFNELSEVMLHCYKNYESYKKIHVEKSYNFIKNYSQDKVSKDLYDIINKRYGSISLSNEGYIKFNKFSDDKNIIYITQNYFDSCKVFLEIRDIKNNVCFFDDIHMIRNVEYWFGHGSPGKKTFIVYDANKSAILFSKTSD